MNKLLPILLVVVLSGCGGNPIENCADKKYKQTTSTRNSSCYSESYRAIYNDFELNYDKYEAEYYKSEEYSVCKEAYGETRWMACLFESPKEDQETLDCYERKKKKLASFINSDLTDKLQRKKYYLLHQRCEKVREVAPKSFDAKWK